VWETNNHPTVRLQSRRRASIPWEFHVRWYEERLADSTSGFFIGMCGDLPVGVVRFDVEGHSAVIAIAVAPAHRGHGFGKRLIALVTDKAFARDDVEVAVAHVREDNLVSQRAFLANGFVAAGSTASPDGVMLRFDKHRE
jgi:RimJ/RimL family protein N-acetyltransferase